MSKRSIKESNSKRDFSSKFTPRTVKQQIWTEKVPTLNKEFLERNKSTLQVTN